MNDRAPALHDLHARGAVRALVASQIREVANAGMGDPDILPFWFGEPDEVTPGYIRDAAVAALAFAAAPAVRWPRGPLLAT